MNGIKRGILENLMLDVGLAETVTDDVCTTVVRRVEEKRPAAPAPSPMSSDLEALLVWHLTRLREEGKDSAYLRSYERGWRGKKVFSS